MGRTEPEMGRLLALLALILGVGGAMSNKWELIEQENLANSTPITHEITLALNTNPEGVYNLTNALDAAADPRSALYGKWLSDEAL